MPKLRNILIFLPFLLPAVAQAQFLPEPVQYIISPEVPGPNQQVTVEVQGVGAFLGDAQITWKEGGKTTSSGVGVRTYTFTTGALGSVTNLRVDIQSDTSGSFTKTFVFRPSTVALVWEADTSAPPLYAGKTLYSGGSQLKVIAFPSVVINGSRVASQSLSYQWTRKDELLAGQSGQGRNVLTLEGDQLQPGEDIRVDVYFGVALVARGRIFVPAVTPIVRLYERDALRGVLTDAALPMGISLTQKEITILAQPYHFSRAATEGAALSYDWTLDGNEITGPDSGRGLLTLRQTGSGAGEGQLAVDIQNNLDEQLVQAASTMLIILFGGTASGGSLFGI